MGAVSTVGEVRDSVLEAEAHVIATLYVLRRLALDRQWVAALGEVLEHQRGALESLRSVAPVVEGAAGRRRRGGRRRTGTGGRSTQRR